MSPSLPTELTEAVSAVGNDGHPVNTFFNNLNGNLPQAKL